MPVYTVQQGDCVSSIAFQFGFSPDTIWNHPENGALKAKRENRNILMAGDNVYVPDKTLREETAATDQRHTYQRKAVPEKLKVCFLRNGKPISNKRFTLDIDGQTSEGSTDSDGNLEYSILPNARSGKVTFPDLDESYPLQLGSLDPVDEISGVQGRLKNLGFFPGEPNGQLDDSTSAAIAAFQSDHNIPSNGQLDAATKNALTQAFGS